MLVGDRDREVAAAALRQHFALGRLSPTELSHRVDLTLRARSRSDLAVALEGLPLTWEELPAGLRSGAQKLRRGVGRVALAVALVGAWWLVSLVLLVAFGVAMLAGASADTALAIVLIAWALATLGCWRVWRGASPP